MTEAANPPAEDEARAWIVTPGSLHLATFYAGSPSANATFAAHAGETAMAHNRHTSNNVFFIT